MNDSGAHDECLLLLFLLVYDGMEWKEDSMRKRDRKSRVFRPLVVVANTPSSVTISRHRHSVNTSWRFPHTYLECVQVDLVQRTIDGRWNLMRHFDVLYYIQWSNDVDDVRLMFLLIDCNHTERTTTIRRGGDVFAAPARRICLSK